MITRTSALSGLSLLALSACNTDPRLPVAFAALDLTITAPTFVYGNGGGVSLAATVMDNRGAMRPDVAVKITPDPVARASTIEEGVQTASFTLEGTGPIMFVACIVEDPEICDQVTLVVDDGRPVLAVDSPTPGEEIDDADGVFVHGTALDTSPALDVFVNGARMTIAENGEFETTLPPRFGVRHIDVLATDALTETARFEMDVLYAADFTPASDLSGAPSFALDDAVGIWLGQDFFDDAQPLSGTTPVVTHDVADIIELVVANASLSQLIPNPVISSPALTLSVNDATLGEPHVELSVTDDGVDLFVRASALSLTTSGTLVVVDEGFSLAGTVTGSVVAYARLAITKPGTNTEVNVSLEDLEIAIEDVEGSFTDPRVSPILNVAVTLLRTTIETYLRNALTGVLSGAVPELLETVLSGIDHALSGTTLNLGQAPLPPLTLTLDGRMRTVESVYRQHVLAPLSISLSTGAPGVHPGSRGVARIVDTATPTNFFDAGAVQVGVNLGFLNGLLHVLWASGLLDLDVKPLIPDFAASLVSEGRLLPRLAPILRPPRENETSDLVLSIGQLELELVTRGVTRRFGVTLEAGVDISLADNVVTLFVAETPTIYVWENEIPTKASIITSDIVRMLLAMVWPQLRNAVVSGLAIELPIPPLPLGGIAPALDGFTITLDETTTRLYPRGELLLLDAVFEGRVPEP